MRIGFLAWNQFQVAHAAEIAKTLPGAEFIFIDRDLAGLKGFNPSWLVPYGAYSRFVSELDLQALDGEYDAVVAQFRPPLQKPWRKTKLIIQQYSLAKPKTAYNSRWFSAGHGLVYGPYSAAIVGAMCPVSQVGNPRFDPVIEGRLDQDVIEEITRRLDPGKPTVVYQPTWGDLSTGTDFSPALAELVEEFNVVAKPHHMTSIKSAGAGIKGLIDLSCVQVLDVGLYLNQIADIVVSDMSGAIFDALYCGKPVVLVGDDSLELESHRKADPTALEVSQRHRIGPYVSDPSALRRTITETLERPERYRSDNEALVEECFAQRGGCAARAGAAIREALEQDGRHADFPLLRRYAAPDFNSSLAARAYSAACKRHKPKHRSGTAERKGSRKRGASFIKNKSFFVAGSHLEMWRFAPRTDMAGAIYQAFNANSALRFSPTAWKGALARLLSANHSADDARGRDLLQKMGLFRTVSSKYIAENLPIPEDLAASINALGSLADFFDLAARNELAPVDSHQVIGADGLVRPLDEAVGGQVVELFLSLSIARELKDEGLRPYRSSQVKFAQNIFEQLLHIGVAVYPRLQGGVSGVSPVAVNSQRVSLTWHTIDQGVPGNLHLKLGTLFGYFIIDEKGYSGWGSPSRMDLASIADRIDAGLADQHWRVLYANLVEGGKSKYSQADDDAPELGEYLFFPMQVFDDTVARLADIDTHSLLRALIEWRKNNTMRVVVKRHPMCKSAAIAATLAEGEASGAIVVSNANIHRLIAGARCVVTVNSGVGAESLLHLKPVITTGGSDYAPATTRVGTVEQLLDVLNEKRWSSASEEDIKKFLYFYTKHYMVECEDREAMSLRLHELLVAAGIQIPVIPISSGVPAIAPNNVEVELAEPILSPREKFISRRKRLQAKSVRRLLNRIKRRGLRYWLDGPTLFAVMRNENIGERAAPVHIGMLASGCPEFQKLLRSCARSSGLKLQERAIDGVPYGATLKKAEGVSSWVGPDIMVRYYYDIDGTAWSPQKISLVVKGAEYAKAIYQASVGRIPASLGAKLSFVLSNPIVAASIVLDEMGLNASIRRIQKKRAPGAASRALGGIFMRNLELRFPMRFLDSVLQGDAENHLRTPEPLEDYLAHRYGARAEFGKGRASMLVGDGFCRSSTPAQMRANLHRVRSELDDLRRLQESPAAGLCGEGVARAVETGPERGSVA